MAVVIETISSNFIGKFKVGDNLVANLGIFRDLIECNEDGRFNKPITIQAGSLVEAAMGQIIYRAQWFNREGVANVSEADRQEIEAKRIDKFAVTIDIFRKYQMLDTLSPMIYDDLHRLRKYRNKVHIQDRINIEGVSVDDTIAFSDAIAGWAVNLCHAVLQFLAETYPRPRGIQGNVTDLYVPRFEEH